MDAPAIALRFRDLGSIDTIAEHRAIMRDEGSVWWGWWKKETEKPHDDLRELFRAPGKVLLVDRSTRRSFLATCLKARNGADAEVDAARVPAYYRDKRDDVAAWLLLSGNIESSPYDDEIDQLFAASGNTTLLKLTDNPAALRNPHEF
jgi:hypothetical protein